MLKTRADFYLKDWVGDEFDLSQKTKILNWYATDTMFNYIQHGNKTYPLNSIKYELNEHDYRFSSEYNKNESNKTIACFGCSNTFGVGLPWNETWPSVLNQKLGNDWNVRNFGVSGAANDTISRLIYKYTLYNDPEAICCFFPEIQRIELYDNLDNSLLKISNRICEDKRSEIYKSYKEMANLMYCTSNFIKNYNFIYFLCKSKGIKFYWYTWSDFILNLLQENKSNIFDENTILEGLYKNPIELNKFARARDNLHYGKDVNYQLGNSFYQKIKNDSFEIKNTGKETKIEIPSTIKLNFINKFIFKIIDKINQKIVQNNDRFIY